MLGGILVAFALTAAGFAAEGAAGPHIFINALRQGRHSRASADEWGNMRGGLEWNHWDSVPLRFGYLETPRHAYDTPPISNFGFGTKLSLHGHDVYYAWAPLSSGHQAHYLSMSWRF